MPLLLKASMAFPFGSKETKALLDAMADLNRVFGKAEGDNMVPAGLAQMAMANKKGPLSAAPPPGIVSNNTPPPGMGGGEEGAAP